MTAFKFKLMGGPEDGRMFIPELLRDAALLLNPVNTSPCITASNGCCYILDDVTKMVATFVYDGVKYPSTNTTGEIKASFYPE